MSDDVAPGQRFGLLAGRDSRGQGQPLHPWADFMLRLMWYVTTRWHMVVLGLLLAAGVTAGVFVIQPAMYESQAKVLLLPSSTQPGIQGAVNPYTGFGPSLSVTADLVRISLDDKGAASELQARGALATYKVIVDQTTTAPVLRITADDHDRALADHTVRALADMASAHLVKAQEDAGAPKNTWITTKVLTVTPQPKPILKNRVQKAALAGVAVIGIFAVTVALIERRRMGRSAQQRQADEAERALEPAPEWLGDAPTPAPVVVTASGSSAARHHIPPAAD